MCNIAGICMWAPIEKLARDMPMIPVLVVIISMKLAATAISGYKMRSKGSGIAWAIPTTGKSMNFVPRSEV
mgnify:CR=1 FL=1